MSDIDLRITRFRGGYAVVWNDIATGKRRRYQLAARTRKEAEPEGRDRFLRETAQRQGGLTVAEIWAGYVEHLGAKPTTKTLGWTGKAVLAKFGAYRPEQITVTDCRAYRRERESVGRKVGTVHTELGHLRSALKWAAKTKLIDHAPYIELPPKPDSDVRPLTPEQTTALLDGCGAPHIRLAVILLLTTGARVGALLDLTWNRVDMARGIIDLRLPDGITRKGRAVVPMNRMSRAALEGAYQARTSDYVIEWAGQRVKSIRTGYYAALRRAGLEDVNIHALRHTVAVKMLQAGRPIEEVSQFLGHSNIQITSKIYARFQPGFLSDAADVLDFGRFGEPRRTSQNGGAK